MSVDPKDRFKFGENWSAFLAGLNESNISEAQKSVSEMLETDNLSGLSFLDIGSGSGMFSLAAHKLGAEVHSFDYDVQSVECTSELRRRYGSEDRWKVEQASVLDDKYMTGLGKFDIVYSWGVLHHTGFMWEAMENTIGRVKEKGICFVAIYNDQGVRSKRWKKVKWTYCSGLAGRLLIKSIFIPWFFIRTILNEIVKGRNPFTVFKRYRKNRGMSVYHDWIDWLGGYPFEVATPSAVFDFFRKRGFSLVRLKTTLGLGCNEFVFRKI